MCQGDGSLDLDPHLWQGPGHSARKSYSGPVLITLVFPLGLVILHVGASVSPPLPSAPLQSWVWGSLLEQWGRFLKELFS